MIRLIPNPTFKARVRFTQPGAEDALVEFEFRHKAPAALAAWVSASADKSAHAAMDEVIVGWSGIIDESGNEVPYSVDSLMAFLAAYTPRSKELFAAYWRELTESRQKN